MKAIEYRALLDLMMCSDPWPHGVKREPIEELLDTEARERGFDDWLDAYHNFEREVDMPFSGSIENKA